MTFFFWKHEANISFFLNQFYQLLFVLDQASLEHTKIHLPLVS